MRVELGQLRFVRPPRRKPRAAPSSMAIAAPWAW